jgi:hypothetical protein
MFAPWPTTAVVASIAGALADAGIATLTFAVGHARPGERAVVAAAQHAASAIAFLRNDARFSTVTVFGSGENSIAAVLAARAGRADGFVGDESPASPVDGFTIDVERARLTIPVAVEGQSIVKGMASFVRKLDGTPQPRRPPGQRVSLRTATITDLGSAVVGIEHAQPSKRSRTIWGALVSYGKWWMPGADEATTLTTSAPIAFGSLAVPAGEYTIYTLPTADEMTLIINRDVNVFHTVYRSSRDLGRVPMTLRTLDTPVEKLTFRVEPSPGGGVLKLIWDDREYSAPFVVTAGR